MPKTKSKIDIDPSIPRHRYAKRVYENGIAEYLLADTDAELQAIKAANERDKSLRRAKQR